MEKSYVNGKFYLGGGRFAEAVSVADGFFRAVGSLDEVTAQAGTVVDLGGRVVLPGFNDSHLHLYNLGLMRSSLRLGNCRSVSDCIEAGRTYLVEKNLPAGEIIVGYSWNQSNFADETRYLDRHDLDKISTTHPIVAYRACAHIVSCNSLTLKLCGIGPNTAPPQGGEIYRDNSGLPTGVLAENAFDLLKPVLPNYNVNQMAEIIKSAMDYAVSCGITSVQTNDIRGENFPQMIAAFNSLYDSGSANLRSYHQCFFPDSSSFKNFLAAGYTTGRGDDMHKIGPLKMFVDGSLGGRTAAMRLPYNDAPDTKGILTMTTEQLDEMVQIAHNSGMSCVVHAIGDAAMDAVLNAYDKVAGATNPLRHGIIHCQITDKGILRRMADKKILALVQPIFLHSDMQILESRVGAKLAATSYAWETMGKLGVPVSFGTDAPVEDINPIENIHCAVSRQNLQGLPKEGYNSAERVSLERAIECYTVESAFASFEEGKKGRIAPGFLADMCVLDKDIFAASPEDILSVKPAMTIIGGEVAWHD